MMLKRLPGMPDHGLCTAANVIKVMLSLRQGLPLDADAVLFARLSSVCLLGFLPWC